MAKAGKEILIKAAALAIPVYAMACLDLTKTFCDDLSALIGHYWWSQMDKTNKIHLVSWEKLSKPKTDGGLGFQNLHYFFFFPEKLPIYSSSIMAVQRTPEIKITSRFVDHLATTTSTEASRRRAAIVAPPSPEPGTTCCSRQSGSRRAKAP